MSHEEILNYHCTQQQSTDEFWKTSLYNKQGHKPLPRPPLDAHKQMHPHSTPSGAFSYEQVCNQAIHSSSLFLNECGLHDSQPAVRGMHFSMSPNEAHFPFLVMDSHIQPMNSQKQPITSYGHTHLSTKKSDRDEMSVNERRVRQITVKSVNQEHRVWIDVLPTETGLSLADKIHHIATFRTKKILKIATAQGRIIPLDARPVFGNWMDMALFENGEHWKVQWTDLDRSIVHNFLSKFSRRTSNIQRINQRDKRIDRL
ncbi:hypothetical protein DM01DRAFT_1339654 [Hesseltinella vesiculosa]|uniref:Uncharacterized protein n=1 Tax=Hesseltinella vesiculosa TaxID=101127 RepID=A0A1X2G6K2_9FUNG|nr:hypothetical protein DM01DRAFT_1339654 [Hesseltinella vesiculosa]